MENILKSHIVFKENHLESITCLVEFSEGDIRAIQLTSSLRSGYFSIPKDAELSSELLQEVASYGRQIEAKKVFKNL